MTSKCDAKDIFQINKTTKMRRRKNEEFRHRLFEEKKIFSICGIEKRNFFLLCSTCLNAWMMTFIIAFRELVTASLIAPPNTLVVSTFIVREFEQGSVSVGMAMAVLCVLFSTTALLILNTVIDHRKVH